MGGRSEEPRWLPGRIRCARRGKALSGGERGLRRAAFGGKVPASDTFHPRQDTSMDPHHHHEESNLKDGLLGIAIAVAGLVIIMGIAHFLALG